MIDFIVNETRNKTRKVILRTAAVMKDIDMLTYKLSDVATAEGIDKNNLASDIEETVDGSVLSRFVDARVAELRKRLSFCLEDEVITVVDNENYLQPEYEFIFTLPSTFKDSELKTAVSMMHDYLVRGALFDWYNKLGTPFGAQLAYEVADLEHKIVDIFREPRVVKHSMIFYQPFGRRR